MPGSRKTKPGILALYGSPRINGHSSTLHRAFLSPLQKVCNIHEFSVYKMKVNPCTACGHCKNIKECIHDDDMTALYRLIPKVKLISISSPLYFSSIPGPLKNVIDRCQVFWEQKQRSTYPVSSSSGHFIATAGSHYTAMFLPSITIIRHLFNTLGTSFNEEQFQLVPNLEFYKTGDTPEKLIWFAYKDGERFASIIH